jgi:F-type H+-transporting ATPase subunit b
LIELDFTFVVFVFSFIAFVFAMKLVFFDPVKMVIKKREAFINNALEETKNALDKIGSANELENPLDILRSAKIKATEVTSKAITEANQEKEVVVKKEVDDLSSKKDFELCDLEKQQNEILSNMDKYVNELSNDAVNKLIAELNIPARA